MISHPAMNTLAYSLLHLKDSSQTTSSQNGNVYIREGMKISLVVEEDANKLQDLFVQGTLRIVPETPTLGDRTYSTELTCRDIYIIGGELKVEKVKIKFRHCFQMNEKQFAKGAECSGIDTSQTDWSAPSHFPKRTFNLTADSEPFYNLKELGNAARNSESKTVQFCLDAKIDRNPKNHKTALMDAAQDNDVAALRALISAGSNLEAVDARGNTALMIAAQNGSVESVKVLIAALANPRARNHFFQTAIDLAIDSAYPDMINFFSNADNILHKPFNPERLCLEMAHAAVNGSIPTMQRLLEEGMDIEATNGHGDTTLILAARYGHTELVEFLIQKKADIHACGENGNALDWTIKNQHIETGLALINAGATIKKMDGVALNILGECDYAVVLLDRIAHMLIEKHPEDAEKVFVNSLQNGFYHTVDHFLVRGMCPNTEIFGELPLMHAIKQKESQNQKKTLQKLLWGGADPFAVLSKLESSDDIEAIELLGHAWQQQSNNHRCDVSPYAANNQGKTALMFAAQKGHIKLVDRLLLAGANPNREDFRGDTALGLATQSGQLEIVKMLINSKTKPITRATALAAMPYVHTAGRDAKHRGYKNRQKHKTQTEISVLLANAIHRLTDPGEKPAEPKIRWALTRKDKWKAKFQNLTKPSHKS